MRYFGEFINEQGRKCSVEIVTGGNTSQSVCIGEPDGGLYFDAEEPVTLEAQADDIFSPLILQRGTIRLQSTRFLPDLFRADCLESVVTITENGVRIFRGFVLPRTYTQDFNSVEDSLDINIIDRLTALQWQRWSNREGLMPLGEIVDYCLDKVGVSKTEAMYFGIPEAEDGSQNAFSEVQVNAKIFKGDEEAENMTLLDVLSEVLKYLNLHAHDDGRNIKIFSWAMLKTIGPEIQLTPQTVYGNDAKIEIGEIWNRIKVVCETDETEELIKDPLDGDECTSPFSRAHHYMTSYNLNTPPPVENDYVMFGRLLYGDTYPDVHCNEAWRRDWWVRVLENPGWSFYRYSSLNNWDWRYPLPDGDDDYRIAAPMYTDDGTQEWQFPDRIRTDMGAGLLEITTGRQEYRPDNNEVATDFDKERVMVIQVGGDTLASVENAGSWFDAGAEEQRKRLAGSCPRAIWRGGKMNLSPSDAETTRYIDISGKFVMVPKEPDATDWSRFENYFFNHQTPGTAEWRDIVKLCRTKKRGEDKQTTFAEIIYRDAEPTTWHERSNDPVENADAPGFRFYQSSEITKAVKIPDIDYGHLGGSNHEATMDLTGKVGVLICALVVGDKCLSGWGDDGAPGDYKWVKFRNGKEGGELSTFTIGFDIKPGDYLLGQEYPILQNMPYSKLLDLKGTAIPIKESDQLEGDVTFMILGPAYLRFYGKRLYNTQNYLPQTVPSDTFRPGGYVPLGDGHNILRQMESIWLKDFNIKLVSDNAGNDPLQECDIVYTSDTDEHYDNPKDEITMKICSALTAQERAELGVSDKTRPNTALDKNFAGVTRLRFPLMGMMKPEQAYVDWYYRECSQPRITLTAAVRVAATNDLLTKIKHPALANGFYATGYSRDLKSGKTEFTLRENVS